MWRRVERSLRQQRHRARDAYLADPGQDPRGDDRRGQAGRRARAEARGGARGRRRRRGDRGHRGRLLEALQPPPGHEDHGHPEPTEALEELRKTRPRRAAARGPADAPGAGADRRGRRSRSRSSRPRRARRSGRPRRSARRRAASGRPATRSRALVDRGQTSERGLRLGVGDRAVRRRPTAASVQLVRRRASRPGRGAGRARPRPTSASAISRRWQLRASRPRRT